MENKVRTHGFRKKVSETIEPHFIELSLKVIRSYLVYFL